MLHRSSYSSGVLAVAATVTALLVWPAAGEAQLGGTLPGGILPGTTTVLADTGTLPAGTSDALQASQLTGGVGSLLTGEVLHAVTIGYPDQIDSEASLATLTLSVAGRNRLAAGVGSPIRFRWSCASSNSASESAAISDVASSR